MQVLTRAGEEWNHVEFTLDDSFAERLRQLRTLVPPLNSLNRNRDLVIDKVRVRLPSAIWRCSGAGEAATEVDGSSIVIAAEGFFNCGGKKRGSREKLVTYTFPIARLIELHAERADAEVALAFEPTGLRASIRFRPQPIQAPATSSGSRSEVNAASL